MNVNAIIETPKGSAEKYDFDTHSRLFKLKKILPSGMAFPYDFGFIPSTKGEDGDPLDIIVISEFKTFPGCMMECRIIGAILAEQTEDGKTARNDRFIGIPVVSSLFSDITSIAGMPERFVKELQDFFVNYNKAEGKKFNPIKVTGPEEALKVIERQQD